MRIRANAVLVLLALVLIPTGLQAQEDEVAKARDDAAIVWVNLLNDGDFAAAAEKANEAVKTQMSAEVLEGMWAQLGGQLGAMESLEPKAQTMEQGFHVVILKGVFGNGTFDVQVVMADDHSVAGFFVIGLGAGKSLGQLAAVPPHPRGQTRNIPAESTFGEGRAQAGLIDGIAIGGDIG